MPCEDRKSVILLTSVVIHPFTERFASSVEKGKEPHRALRQARVGMPKCSRSSCKADTEASARKGLSVRTCISLAHASSRMGYL